MGVRFLFATGNVDAGRIDEVTGTINADFLPTASVDRFFVSAGLENFEQKDDPTAPTVASGIRAFMRNETSLGMSLADSGLYVVNTGSDGSNAQNAILHADFGMSGTGANQSSTISVTIGDLNYTLSPPVPGTPDTYNVEVDARTVGSSRGPENSVAITSGLTSTAAGGGNPDLVRDGYAGYLVLENYVPDAAGACGSADYCGGTERASNGDTIDYAMLRLATATGSESGLSRNTLGLSGWAGGLTERVDGDGNVTVVPVGTGTSPGNLNIQTDPITNRVQTTLGLGERGTLTLGGLTSSSAPSAFVDDKRFAAGTDTVAMVSAEVFRNAAGNLPEALSAVANYEHLKWGFFFGDIPQASGGGSATDHLHMGTWVAGRAADPSEIPSTGSASYQGHAIGNVSTGGSLYTAVGTYENTWNFAQRSGTMAMDFDGVDYTGVTQLQSGSVVFQGQFAGGQRNGGVVGSFFGSTPGSAPAAVGGRFVIRENTGATAYRASGTFGAERRP